jgi:hypothetical protein
MNDREKEREKHDVFLKQHQAFYDQIVKVLADCIEQDDSHELSLHVAYLSKIIEAALNLQLLAQRRSGNA